MLIDERIVDIINSTFVNSDEFFCVCPVATRPRRQLASFSQSKTLENKLCKVFVFELVKV